MKTLNHREHRENRNAFALPLWSLGSLFFKPLLKSQVAYTAAGCSKIDFFVSIGTRSSADIGTLK